MEQPRRRPVKVGLHLPDAEGMMDGRTARWPDLAAMARRAEELGFDSLWVADHHLFVGVPGPAHPPVGFWEGWSLLAALAAVTTRVELGPLVSCMGFRNPALLAKMADALDEVSGGRLILALGAGWHEPEFRAFGFPFDRRVARFAEGLRIVHDLLREGRVDFDGAFYQVRGCELRPRGPRPNGPPLWVGTFGERMLRLTARYADAWNMEWTGEAAATLPWRAKVDAACAEVGRDPATLARTACVMVDLPGWESRPGRDWVTDMRADVGPATGSAEQLAAVLRGYAAAGISHVQVMLAPNTLAGIEAFAPVLELLDRDLGAGGVA